MNPTAERLWRSMPDSARTAVKTVWTGYARVTSFLRLLPDYLIIGTQRGGTTSLYKYLVRHPGHAQALTKELRFFDLNYERGVSWYRSRFPSAPYRALSNWVRGIDLVIGEASPDYLFHPHVPSRVATVLPDARFVILLRNPADRAHSHYWHQFKRGHETLSFADAIDREADRLGGELGTTSRDPSQGSYERHHHSYLARGLYFEQLRRWTDLFPRDRFLIERSEDLFSDPGAVCQRVLAFLGLPARDLGPYEVFNAFAEDEMDSDIRHHLVDYFREPNSRLYDFLGRDLGWDH